MMTGSAGWGDAIVAVPWELYESYGDEQVLAENWDAMVRWVEWALEKARTERHHARSAAEPAARAVRGVPVGRHLPLGRVDRAEGASRRRHPDRPDQDEPDGVVHGGQGRSRHRLPLPLDGDTLAGRLRSSATTTRRHATRAPPSRSVSAWQAAYLHADGTTVADTQAELRARTVVRTGA